MTGMTTSIPATTTAPAAAAVDAEQAKGVAFRLAAALASRRLYASGNPTLQRTLEALASDLAACFARPGVESISVALMTQGISVAGVPLLALSDSVLRLATQMRQRGIEILSIGRGAGQAELETMLALLNADVAELTAVDVGQWLKDRGAHHVGVKHLELAEAKVARSIREIYGKGREALGKEFKRAAEKGALELGAMSELAGTMLDLVLRSDVPIATLLALRGREDFTFTHSMNVSMLAQAQASTLGLDEAMVRSIGIAALVHDIGKTTIPDAILMKSKLSASELAMVQSHAAEGARILLRTQGGDGFEAVVAAEHHAPYTDEPHLASQIVAVADAFDTIRSLRPFSDRASLRAALRFLLKHMRHRLNPYLLQRFCLMCGMYQAGDVVHLTTGEVARVVSPSAEMGSRPIIEVVDSGTGRAPVGTVADLSQPHLAQVGIQKDPVLAFSDLTLAAVDAMG